MCIKCYIVELKKEHFGLWEQSKKPLERQFLNFFLTDLKNRFIGLTGGADILGKVKQCMETNKTSHGRFGRK